MGHFAGRKLRTLELCTRDLRTLKLRTLKLRTLKLRNLKLRNLAIRRREAPSPLSLHGMPFILVHCDFVTTPKRFLIEKLSTSC